MGRFLDRSDVGSALDQRQISDMMLLLKPQKTPVMSMVKKKTGQLKNALVEWPFETESAPVTTPVADATDVAETDFENFEGNYGLLAGRPHKTRVAIGVGEVAEATTEQFASNRLFAKNTVRAMRKLKANMEAIILGTQDSAATVSSNKTTYRTRGIGCWSGAVTATDSGAPIPDDAKCPAASRVNLATAAYSTLTEAQVRAILQSIFDASNEEADNMVGVCLSDIKMRFADFTLSGSTASNTMPLRRWDNSSANKAISVRVDRYIGDFGSLNLVPHTSTFLPQTAAASGVSIGMYVLDPEVLAANIVVPIAFKRLEDRGGGPRGFCSTTFVNTVINPLRIGVVHKTNAA